jgi:outer membrane protein, heavy metal efflux system
MQITFIVITLLLTGYSAEVHAAELNKHHRLSTDPSLTLQALVDRTVQATPTRLALRSHKQLGAAWETRASSWIADSPALTLRYQTDRFNEHADLQEYEAGLELPLWRWGERSATAAFARSLDKESQHALAHLRWELAGVVRQSLWQIAEAELDLEMATKSASLAAKANAKVKRAHQLGELPKSDALIAQSNALQANTVLWEKEAALVDAEQTFASLTQGSTMPSFTPETLSRTTELPADHVLVQWLNSQVASAKAAHKRIAKSSRGSPSLLLGPRREQAANDPEYVDSFGVTLRLPFGTRAHSAPAVATAAQALAHATAHRDRQLRSLQLMFHEAAHNLRVITEQLTANQTRAALADEQINMAERAFDAGELNVLDLMQIQKTALSAQRQSGLLNIAHHRAIAAYNQAVGETP